MLVMALIGIVVALVRWKRHSKVSALTLIALDLSLANAVISTIIFYVFSSPLLGNVGLYLLQDFFQMITIILLVTAALFQRNSRFKTN